MNIKVARFNINKIRQFKSHGISNKKTQVYRFASTPKNNKNASKIHNVQAQINKLEEQLNKKYKTYYNLLEYLQKDLDNKKVWNNLGNTIIQQQPEFMQFFGEYIEFQKAHFDLFTLQSSGKISNLSLIDFKLNDISLDGINDIVDISYLNINYINTTLQDTKFNSLFKDQQFIHRIIKDYIDPAYEKEPIHTEYSDQLLQYSSKLNLQYMHLHAHILSTSLKQLIAEQKIATSQFSKNLTLYNSSPLKLQLNSIIKNLNILHQTQNQTSVQQYLDLVLLQITNQRINKFIDTKPLTSSQYLTLQATFKANCLTKDKKNMNNPYIQQLYERLDNQLDYPFF